MALPRLFKRSEEIDPPGVTPAWLVRSVNAIAWLFVAILVMTVFLRSLDIARDKAVPLEISHAGLWSGETWAFWFPLFAPLVLAAIALPWTAKVIIPAFCSFDWRNPRHRAPKIWCAVITFFVAIVTMTSGFPLYHGAYNERFKQEAVKLEQVDQRRAALEAEKQSIDEDLKALAESPNKYQAGAALAGAEAWKKRIEQARANNDPQLGMIEKALSDAERGDQLRAERKKAIVAVATAPTKASAMEQVKGAQSYGSDAVVDFINAWWGFAFFIVIEMCALIAGWISYMMQMMRTQQIADYEAVHSAPVPEAGIDTLAIEDHSDEWQVRPQEKEYDEEGNELIKVQRRKEVHYRRKPKKKDEPGKKDPRAAADSGMFDGLNGEGDERLVLGEEVRRSSEVQEAVAGEAKDDFDQEVAGTDDSWPVHEESLAHAEEDQQADERVDVEADGLQDDPVQDGQDAAAVVYQDQAADEGDLDDAFQAPDEQASGPEVSETEDGQFVFDDPQPETRLPDGEGVLVHTEEDLERQRARRETEAAE